MFSGISLYTASVWILPVLLAITFHEAAHGFVARYFGDETASRLGRVSLNPLKHIDLFGTVILPGVLVLSQSPFIFGYAKPVPVNFSALRNPRADMAWVAIAGPATNIALAILAALSFHLLGLAPTAAAQWIFDNLKNAVLINAILAVFNMFPLPPLDGGRIAVSILPDVIARPLARLEPYGMLILITLVILIPLLGSQLGANLNFASQAISAATGFVIRMVLLVTGNT
ncbi:site-2 protease family protein [Bradyrhizobium sp. LHD-71]|uniref:site-2 protease family protein n=1 Tax=Bradyrhizobium sp. LHD-71 TaxID=3072141 RepID=UPI00280C74F6|nr:site-2 protease family protein [Bradyrhizobium sp. LHD-71]MDQ8731025.1 site-2 protease family protein [Bradyrhizobium sp. LHD-71]